MSNIFAGKTAVVTGSRGIGEAIVRSLHAKGVNLIVVSASDSSSKLVASLPPPGQVKAQSTVDGLLQDLHLKSVSKVKNNAVAIHANLSSATSAKDLAAKIVQASTDLGTDGKIDYLILAAGIMPVVSLDKIDEATWSNVFNVNVVGPVFLTKELASHINKEGRIILFSSSLTISSGVIPGQLPYLASKGAIEQTARVLSKDPIFVSHGISTSVISPGPTETSMFTTGKSDDLIKTTKANNPYGRLGTPEEIATVVESVITGGKWLNGSHIRATGGSLV